MSGATQAAKKQFEEQGVVVVEEAIGGEELQRLQQVFDHWTEECKEDWLDQVERGDAAPVWCDIPDPLEKDEAFVDLVDHPSYCDLLLDITDGELLFGGLAARTVPPWPLAYTGWHPDMERSAPLHPKMQIYLNDVPPRGGEFGFVPGSHKTNDDTFFRPQCNHTMPRHKALPGQAGTAIIFNAVGLHTAMDNCTLTPRKSIIMGYNKIKLQEPEPDSRFSSIAHLCTTPQRRKLFGLEV